MTVFIDRANPNGPASADNLRAAPVTHLYAKATEGTTFKDDTWADRKAAAAAAGAKFGSYHFAGHGDPEAEAEAFLAKIGTPQPGDLRPCLDLEDHQSVDWAQRFVTRVHDHLGYWPVLYGSTSFIAPMRAASATLKKCPWWRAEYGPNDGARHALQGGDMGAVAHQYTSVATVPGIAGRTDRSELIDEKALLVPGATVFRPYAAYKNGKHVRNFRRYRLGVIVWAIRHRPHAGDSIQIRHRKKP